MGLIDWSGLARSALWIVGLALALAACSYVAWRGEPMGQRLRDAVLWPPFRLSFALGMALFAGGMSWGALRLWERVAWGVIAAAFIWQASAAGCAFRRWHPAKGG